MAAVSFSKHSNQVRFSWSDENHSRSKAQMSLKKILDFISSSCNPPSLMNERFESQVVKDEKEEAEEKATYEGKEEIVIDVKLQLGSEKTLEENQSTGLSAACSGVGEVDGVTVKFCSSAVVENVSVLTMVDKSSEGECDVANSSDDSPPANQPTKDEEKEEVEAESVITNLNVQSSLIEAKQICEEESHHAEKRNTETKKPKKDGYLSLLVEAAKLVSGGFEDDRKPNKRVRGKRGFRDEANEKIITETEPETETELNDSIRCGKKTDDRWMSEFYDDFEDVSPVVRSKRGRNQVLPSKYRDSVLEPWKNISRPRSSRVSSSKPRTR